MSRIAMAWSVSLIASVVGCACEPPPRAADHGASWPRGSVAARPATRGIQIYYQEQRQKLEAFEAPTDDVRAAVLNNLAIVALRMGDVAGARSAVRELKALVPKVDAAALKLDVRIPALDRVLTGKWLLKNPCP